MYETDSEIYEPVRFVIDADTTLTNAFGNALDKFSTLQLDPTAFDLIDEGVTGTGIVLLEGFGDALTLDSDASSDTGWPTGTPTFQLFSPGAEFTYTAGSGVGGGLSTTEGTITFTNPQNIARDSLVEVVINVTQLPNDADAETDFITEFQDTSSGISVKTGSANITTTGMHVIALDTFGSQDTADFTDIDNIVMAIQEETDDDTPLTFTVEELRIGFNSDGVSAAGPAISLDDSDTTIDVTSGVMEVVVTNAVSLNLSNAESRLYIWRLMNDSDVCQAIAQGVLPVNFID